jgi:hypothetical protein
MQLKREPMRNPDSVFARLGGARARPRQRDNSTTYTSRIGNSKKDTHCIVLQPNGNHHAGKALPLLSALVMLEIFVRPSSLKDQEKVLLRK